MGTNNSINTQQSQHTLNIALKGGNQTEGWDTLVPDEADSWGTGDGVGLDADTDQLERHQHHKMFRTLNAELRISRFWFTWVTFMKVNIYISLKKPYMFDKSGYDLRIRCAETDKQ
jgi:hypothetical protein